MREPSGMCVGAEAVGIAAAVDALVVAEHDVGDRAVALDAADELGALLGMELDDLPLLVGQLAVGDEDRVGEDELADVVEQAGGVDELLLALGEAEQAGHLARVAGDGGGVARRHGVAHRERLHHGVDEADLERRELLRPLLELLAAVVGLDAGLEQVLEDEQHDGGETDGADAEALVAEGDAGGQQGRWRTATGGP